MYNNSSDGSSNNGAGISNKGTSGRRENQPQANRTTVANDQRLRIERRKDTTPGGSVTLPHCVAVVDELRQNLPLDSSILIWKSETKIFIGA